MESLNPSIIDEEDKINLVTYCTFTSTHIVKDEDGNEIKLNLLDPEKHQEDIEIVKNGLSIKVVRQKILYKGEVYELREIYGLNDEK